MKRIFTLLIGFMFLASAAFGAVGVNEDGTYQGEATTLDLPATWVTGFDGSTITIDPTPIVPLQLTDFVSVSKGSTTTIPLSATTTPALTTNNGAWSLVWGDSATSYAQITFRVPADYSSGGAFRIIADQDGDPASESDCEIDFELVINTVVTGLQAWSTYRADEDQVALGLEVHGSPVVITLTPASQSTITAGALIALNIWRSNDTSVDGTNANALSDLEVYYAEFFYSAN